MWLWIIAVLVAFFIKGLCGFANSIILSSILSFEANNINISPVELMLGYPSNIILTIKNREKLKKSIYLPIAMLTIIGSIPGALFLKNVDSRYVKIVFGVVVILLGIEMLFREVRNTKIRDSKLLLIAIGLATGVICGVFGIGALLAAYISRVTDATDEFKANMSAVFWAENTFRIITYAILGVITFESIKQAIMLLPVMLIGLFAGIRSGQILDEKIVKKMVIVMLIISGIALMIINI